MKVKIFGKPNCVFCNRAKHLVTTKPGIQSTYIDMEVEGIDKEMLTELCGKPVSTIPQIFVDGVHIGGYTELVPIIQKFDPEQFNKEKPKIVDVAELGTI
jgi:glutaredoxin 1